MCRFSLKKGEFWEVGVGDWQCMQDIFFFFLSLRMNKCLERVNGRHFWNPRVFSYEMIPRCCPNSRFFFFHRHIFSLWLLLSGPGFNPFSHHVRTILLLRPKRRKILLELSSQYNDSKIWHLVFHSFSFWFLIVCWEMDKTVSSQECFFLHTHRGAELLKKWTWSIIIIILPNN